MDAISEIEQKLTDYENHYIFENKLLTDKLNDYIDKEKKYKEQIISLYNKIDELKFILSNKNKKNEFDSKLIKEENIEIKDEYNLIKNENNKLKKELNNEKIKNELLVNKYNELTNLYEEKEKENITLRGKIKFKEKQSLDNINNKQCLEMEKNEKNKILEYCNNTISVIIKWIETNLISFNDNDNYNPCEYLNIECYNNLIIFGKLRDSLLKAKREFDSRINQINMQLKEKKQNIENTQNKQKQDNNLLQKIYKHFYKEVSNGNYFNINNNDNANNKSGHNDNFYFNEIENMINKTFELLKKIKESSYNKSLDKLVMDNTQLNKEIEMLKEKMINLYEDNKLLYNYNNELEKEIEELRTKLTNKDGESIQNENQMLINDNIKLISQLNKMKNQMNEN